MADENRYISLGVDRLSLFYALQAELPAGDPLRGLNMIGRFRVGNAMLALRRAEPGLPSPAREASQRLRRATADVYRRQDPVEGRAALLERVESAFDLAAAATPSGGRRTALEALIGLRLALRPDAAFEALLRTAGP